VLDAAFADAAVDREPAASLRAVAVSQGEIGRGYTKRGLTVMQARDQVMRARHVRATPGIARRRSAVRVLPSDARPLNECRETPRAGSPLYSRAMTRLLRAQSPEAAGFASGRSKQTHCRRSELEKVRPRYIATMHMQTPWRWYVVGGRTLG